MQTEDIELSTRAMLGGRVKISFCPECRSDELPPATLLALYRQRLRWALGWDQFVLRKEALLRHDRQCVGSSGAHIWQS